MRGREVLLEFKRTRTQRKKHRWTSVVLWKSGWGWQICLSLSRPSFSLFFAYLLLSLSTLLFFLWQICLSRNVCSSLSFFLCCPCGALSVFLCLLPVCSDSRAAVPHICSALLSSCPVPSEISGLLCVWGGVWVCLCVCTIWSKICGQSWFRTVFHVYG